MPTTPPAFVFGSSVPHTPHSWTLTAEDDLRLAAATALRLRNPDPGRHEHAVKRRLELGIPVRMRKT